MSCFGQAARGSTEGWAGCADPLMWRSSAVRSAAENVQLNGRAVRL